MMVWGEQEVIVFVRSIMKVIFYYCMLKTISMKAQARMRIGRGPGLKFVPEKKSGRGPSRACPTGRTRGRPDFVKTYIISITYD